MQELTGKVAVVTGAASGIGRAMALCLAGEGVKVAVLDIDETGAQAVVGEISSQGGHAQAFACDVSLRDDMRAVADQVFGAFDDVHILCNNAGVTCFKPVSDMTDEDWDWMISVDLMSVVYGYQTYLPRMIAQGGEGHVVNSSSGVGIVPDMLPGHTAYAAAKSGIVGLTSSLRVELADKGIGVSVLCPKMVRTDILRSGRVRQDRYGGPTEITEIVPGRPDPLHDAMDPMEVGRAVVDAIRCNRKFIFPHPDMKQQVVAYYERMLADFV
jgi:NAD(P)-dependent dehydrogenase (short-subunit alcohol dehydrogenase family)